MFIGNYKLRLECLFHCPKIRTKFRKNLSSDSKLKIGKILRKHIYFCVHNISMKFTSIVVAVVIIPRIRVLPEKLTCPQLVKKFPSFYGSRKFITTFTSARHLSLSWATAIQSMLPHSTSERLILILSFHLRLCLPSGLLHSGLPTKTCMLLSLIRTACPTHLIFL